MAAYTEDTGISVGTTATDLKTFDVANYVSLGVKINITGANALNDFDIYAKFHANDPAWNILYTSSSDYTAPAGFLQAAGTSDSTNNLCAIPASGSGWFVMDVLGFHQVKIVATGAASTTAAVRAILQ